MANNTDESGPKQRVLISIDQLTIDLLKTIEIVTANIYDDAGKGIPAINRSWLIRSLVKREAKRLIRKYPNRKNDVYRYVRARGKAALKSLKEGF